MSDRPTPEKIHNHSIELALQFYEIAHFRRWDRDDAITRYYAHPSTNAAVKHIARLLLDELERQLAAKTEECEGWEKQWREAAMNALTDKTRDELAEARAVIRKMELAIQHHEKRADKALEIAGDLIAMIRVNVMRDTFREATIEQVDDHLKPWIQRIATINETTQ